MAKYQTEQKKLLLRYMEKSENRQFSAEELAMALIAEGEKAPGKSTVYRLVTELYSEGTLRRFPKTEGRGWLYQYHGAGGCSGHLHLKCVSCGKLLHLNCGMSEELLEHRYIGSRWTTEPPCFTVCAPIVGRIAPISRPCR